VATHRTSALLALVASAALIGATRARPAAPTFIAHTIATGLTEGYQVVVADLNRDAKPDVIDEGIRRLGSVIERKLARAR